MYINKLFEEFKLAYGIKNEEKTISDLKPHFSKWLIKKQKAMQDYVELLNYMEICSNSVAEMNKGIYDTVAIELQNKYLAEPMIISEYADTFVGLDEDIDIYKGSLRVNEDNIYLKYLNNYCTNPDFYYIDTFLTQLPITIEELIPFFKMINTNKTVYLGAYGSLNDRNSKDNLEELQCLYKMFKNNSNREIEYDNETINNNYVAIIKVSDDKTRTRNR